MKGQSFFYVRSGSFISKAKHWRKDRAHQHQMQLTRHNSNVECSFGGGGCGGVCKALKHSFLKVLNRKKEEKLQQKSTLV